MIKLIEAKLTRLLFYTNQLEVKSFTSLPKLMKSDYYQKYGGDVNLSVISNCYLIIRYTGNPENKDFKSKMYTMSLKNRRNTQRFFASILNWLEDSAYENMFYYNDDALEFNLDYKDFELTTPSSKHSEYRMQARPIVYEDNMGRREGVALTFNLQENTAFMSWEDFVVLADIVLNFNFEVESLLLMNSFMTSCKLDRITTPNEEKINRRIERGSKDPFV